MYIHTHFSPENVVFTQDGIAKIVFRGIKGQVPPYEEYLKKNFEAVQINDCSNTRFEILSLQNYLKGN